MTLHPGQRVIYGREVCEVRFVNQSRAYLVPVEPERVRFFDRLLGRLRVYNARRPGFSVSPNSELPVVPAGNVGQLEFGL